MDDKPLDKDTILYKYRAFDANALSMLINRELFFASPQQLNDPYDCQISIKAGLEAAINFFENMFGEDNLKRTKLHVIKNILEEGNITESNSGAGILSLSFLNSNPLMWAHYAEEHRGFCIGFQLLGKTSKFIPIPNVLGLFEMKYFHKNPYIDYFLDLTTTLNIDEDDFWANMLSIGFGSKSKSWEHEKEVRFVRIAPGTVPFKPIKLKEVIFGLKMSKEHRQTIRQLLSGPEWKHIHWQQVTKAGSTFGLKIEDI